MSMGKRVQTRRFLLAAALFLAVAAVLAVWIQTRLQAQVSAQLQQHDAQFIGAVQQAAPDMLPAVMAALKTDDAALIPLGRQALGTYGYQALPIALSTQGLLLLQSLSVALLGCALWGGSQWRISRQVRRITQRVSDTLSGRVALDLHENTEGDISILQNELAKMSAALLHQKEEATRGRALLKDALSDISHQIKTPITSVVMLNDLLLSTPVSADKQKEFLARMQTQHLRISWLVEALLKLSKLDAGSVQMRMQSVPVETLCAHALLPLTQWMQRYDVIVQQADMDGLTLYCDAGWMAEALMNILKNCIEHTGPGKHVYISAETNALYTQIQIRDEGEGIDPEDLPHLFERFYRGKNASPDSVGIGLAMSQRIVQEHGGVIDVHSARGAGSVFTIRVFTHLQTRAQAQNAANAM